MKLYYKYCTADTAKKIIETMSFQWCSPLKFNDPFDSQVNIYAGDDYIEESVQLFIKEMKVGSGDDTDNELKKSMEHQACKLKFAFSKMQPKWKEYASYIRVFCISEVVDSLLMWAHYADSHQGVVFEVDLSDKVELRSVEYHRSMAKMGITIDDLLENEDYVNDFFFDNIFLKSDQWGYEKEWRAFKIIENPAEVDDNLYLKFDKKNIKSVYFGCMISDSNKDMLLRLIQNNLPESNVYQAYKHKSEYGLEFIAFKRTSE